ncbi:MinD-like ATPase involved in chromosome partitioning or flagellar assembly [Desulfotomaculum arcticum]|uniref:MinD-like ATPase involved in chromosome partitioning or flagellar assembly n=1 Tax=Desulfotruncus arcticus DSM 17038 TaxID=1121424 RepID=A0A1I2Z8T4_9FIRM|nr:AAA family ATPase [Desulfotruncus arcticus]SFH34273.1 MinD-like ATPase involved in chromosome partitioning or flagellar assembly [Desulfotomaculum arcticum] [Desulfotruncus arcticus DSM 17038]
MISISKLFKRNKNKQDEESTIIWKSSDQSNSQEENVEENVTSLYNIPISPKAIQGEGTIITVQCAKHGDGATTVAANIAASLAKGNPEKVALVDLDGYGSVRSRFGLLASECLINILDWEDVQGVRDMAMAMYSHTSGVVLVPGVIHYDHIKKVSPDLIFKTLTILKNNFDVIVLDCPPLGQANNTWTAAIVSDIVLSILKPDRTSIDHYPENKSYANRLGCGERYITVLNQSAIPGGIRSADLLNNKELDIGIAAVLPYSVNVNEENNRRKLICHSKPKDQFSQAINELVSELIS